MLKKILLMVLILTTATRFVGVVLTLQPGNTSLPTVVLVLTSITVLYGIYFCVRRYVFTLRLAHFVQFYVVQSAVFVFNLVFVSRNVLLSLTLTEIIVVGTLLDVLIGLVAIYYSVKGIRKIKSVGKNQL